MSDVTSVTFDLATGGAASWAQQTAVASQLPGRGDGFADGYRHILLSAELYRISDNETYPNAVLAAHELSSDFENSKQVDIRNNEIGKIIGLYVKAHGGTVDDIILLANKVIDGSVSGKNFSEARWIPAGSGTWIIDGAKGVVLPNGVIVPPIVALHPDDWVTNPKLDGVEQSNENSNWPTGDWRAGFDFEGAPAAIEYLNNAPEAGKLEKCFPAGTLITVADGTTKPIEHIRHGDIVLSHDKNGNLTPSVVDKLFTNTTDAFIRLSFTDGRKDLIATPGHHFLTEAGDYMEIGHMARLCGGNVRLVDTDGSIISATAERLEYSAETADLFEQSQTKTIAFSGSTMLIRRAA